MFRDVPRKLKPATLPSKIGLPVLIEPGEYSYLASPYSVHNPVSNHQAITLRARRYKHVCLLAGRLMKEGHAIFCPIAHSHPIETIGMQGAINDFDFWMKQDLPVLRRASELLVYKLDGWEHSRGVAEEIRVANEEGIPIRYIDNIRWKQDKSGRISSIRE